MKTIVKILNVEPFKVTCEFNSGEIRAIDLQSIIEEYGKTSPDFYAKLLDDNFFCSVFIDSYGTLAWPNELELDPDNLYLLSEPSEKYGS